MLTSPENMEAEKKLAEDSKPFINIKLQNGPIKECGVNGCQIDAIILFCRDKIFEFNNILPFGKETYEDGDEKKDIKTRIKGR